MVAPHVQQNPAPKELFRYLLTYRVLVCTTCRYAVQPDSLSRHLKDIHHLYRANRRPYIDYATKFDLAEPEQVLGAYVAKFPVQGLPVLDGLQCLGAGACNHLCVSTKRMQGHWVATHGRRGRQNEGDWKPAPLQTFFKGNLLHYFTRSSSPSQLADAFQDVTRSEQSLLQITHTYDKDWASFDPCLVLWPGLPSDHLTTALDNLDELDQNLLFHYLTSTYLTFVDRHGDETIWQQTIPQIAASNPFLLSSLLACSGLHLAHKHPSTSSLYSVRAHMHQNAAMPLFRHAIANVDDSNCHAILGFCHLLIIYSLVADSADEQLLLGDLSSQEPNMMCSWLYFIRNGCLLVCDYWDKIECGPLSSLATCWDTKIGGIEKYSSTQGMTTHLLSIIPDIDTITTFKIEDGNQDKTDGERDNWSPSTCQVYTEAATQLGWAFAASQALKGNGFTTWDAVRVWPAEVSVEYVQLLIENHPAGLILLAHFCLLIERLQHEWYFEGRARSLFEKVLNRLDEKWHPYIKHSCDERDSLLWFSNWSSQDQEVLIPSLF